MEELKAGIQSAGNSFKNIITENIERWDEELPERTKEKTKAAGGKIAKNLFDGLIEQFNKDKNKIVEDELKKVFDIMISIGMSEEQIRRFADKCGGDIQKVIEEFKKLWGDDLSIEIPIVPKVDVNPTTADAKEEGDKLAETFMNIGNAVESSANRTDKAGKKWKNFNSISGKAKDNLNKASYAMEDMNQGFALSAQLCSALTGAFEEGSAAYKAFAISTIIADTAAGITAAMADAFKDPDTGGFWARVAAAAATSTALAINGAVQIANIAKGKVDGGNFGTTVTPQVSTTAIQESNWQGADYKVYVTETDITSTQNKVKVIEEQSRY